MTHGYDEQDGTYIPARIVPVPTTISAQAQALLARPPQLLEPVLLNVNGRAALRAHIEKHDQLLMKFTATQMQSSSAQIVTHRLARCPLYEVVPTKIAEDYTARAILFLHGGAYVYGSGLLAAHMSLGLAAASAIRVFSVDYRMPPDHPFPTGLDDTIAAYRFLLQRYKPRDIAVAGVSAGGGLAAAFVLKARASGLPLPAACVLSTPEADLTESGDSFHTNETVDVILRHGQPVLNALYAGGHDLRDPYLSPVYGDFSKGFPPTLLTTGTRDLFLSNTVLLHRALRRAGIAAELHVWEAMPHGGFFGAPEDQELLAEQVRFLYEHLRS